jgi:hypothetical protein
MCGPVINDQSHPAFIGKFEYIRIAGNYTARGKAVWTIFAWIGGLQNPYQETPRQPVQWLAWDIISI